MPALLLTARWVFPAPGRSCDRGGLLVRRRKVASVLSDRRAVERCARAEGLRAVDLGDHVLAPGFVDAHAHLELSALAGKLDGRGSFASWIRALVRARGELSPAQLRRSVLEGARLLVAGGTTSVGDIDSSGAAESVLERSPMRARIFREVLDAGDPLRARAASRRASRSFHRSARLHPGLSPHAPYTAGPELLKSVHELSLRRRWPVCVHWAETHEEVEWLALGRGPFRAILSRPGAARREAARAQDNGLSMLARAGLLSSRLTLVHGNHPAPGDVERVAAAGATLVHCPGTHAFFGREPFALSRWLAAGVPVAIGTDGLSSNRALDMRLEMALLRKSHPDLAPARVFEMATRAGARALGLSGSAGTLEPGAWADAGAHGFPDLSRREAANPKALLDALTSGRSTVDAAWIGGRQVLPGGEFSRRISESPGRIAE